MRDVMIAIAVCFGVYSFSYVVQSVINLLRAFLSLLGMCFCSYQERRSFEYWCDSQVKISENEAKKETVAATDAATANAVFPPPTGTKQNKGGIHIILAPWKFISKAVSSLIVDAIKGKLKKFLGL